jgi:GTP diphosphokinase / guanosine-3',5'-bis(diphosphate) 3'-diphosphatase
MEIVNSLFLNALLFATEKHTLQRRKGSGNVPYVNHLVKVTHLLFDTGRETDITLLTAALLHDVLEDTDTTEAELLQKFGDKVTYIVKEVTDDMSLPYSERKRLQIEKALHISNDAKKIKIADKISNIHDILDLELTWNLQRKIQYVTWSKQVVEQCKGINLLLDKAFDDVYIYALNKLNNA